VNPWLAAGVAICAWSALAAAAPTASSVLQASREHGTSLFATSDACLVCHNNLTSPAGEDVSIGADWRATMMANSARDPYWQAAVRRELADHPSAGSLIEDECAVCHMPMARTVARADGRRGKVFSHLPVTPNSAPAARLAHDGVSCAVCHQITGEKLGTADSFTGGYVIDLQANVRRVMFGPFAVDKGRTTIMRSSTGFVPAESAHVQQSELCATCHTLFTEARNERGEVIGRLPEQTPYLEWRHSAVAASQSCQSCHMPLVKEDTPVASVLGEPRRLARHVFRGGNFFMLRLLDRYRAELGVEAPSVDLQRSARQTLEYLQSDAAAIAIDGAQWDASGRLAIDVTVQNRSGHKLPTGYPSRRVWLHLRVRDAAGRPVFESGATDSTGLIRGNDNDRDPLAVEPHYQEITSGEQVQIYEAVMADPKGSLTTGLLKATQFVKDNRLLPRGFDKHAAADEIAVRGSAGADDDFEGGKDCVRYRVDAPAAAGPYDIEVELRFQPIAYRWAANLASYNSTETRRFVAYYQSMASSSSELLARATARASASHP
jgi:hypothetical protein